MLRMSESEHAEYIARRSKQGIEEAKACKGIVTLAPQKKTLVVTIPGTLPTWNRLLAAGIWKRKKIRDEIHKRVADAVSQSFRIEKDCVIPTA